MSQWSGKNIIVIGGSSGIGLEVVKQLAKEQAHVWACSRHASDELQEIEAKFIKLDVTGDVSSLSEITAPVHGLIYCPGTINLKPFRGLKMEDFEKDMEINLYGAIKVIQHFLKQLKNSEGSSIVLFSTVAVSQGMSFHASVAAAKGAVEGLAKSLAAELAASNIRVNVIAPSLTDTPLAASLLSTEDKKEASKKRHPLNKIGTAAELASMTKYLVSDASTWITGQTFHLDGGLSSIKSL